VEYDTDIIDAAANVRAPQIVSRKSFILPPSIELHDVYICRLYFHFEPWRRLGCAVSETSFMSIILTPRVSRFQSTCQVQLAWPSSLFLGSPAVPFLTFSLASFLLGMTCRNDFAQSPYSNHLSMISAT
jgi:hypothetical protein